MAPATIERCSLQTPNLKQEEPSLMENTAARKRKQVPEGYLIIGVTPGLQEAAATRFDQAFTGKYNEHRKEVSGKYNAKITP
jgi:hypothetical protein